MYLSVTRCISRVGAEGQSNNHANKLLYIVLFIAVNQNVVTPIETPYNDHYYHCICDQEEIDTDFCFVFVFAVVTTVFVLFLFF